MPSIPPQSLQTLAPRSEGPGILGWFEAGACRKCAGLGQPVGAMPGLGWSQAPAGRVGGHSCCGGLTVGEVSFGGAWPGSRIRRDEGGHSGRFRLGRLGRVQSLREVSALPQHEGCYEGDDEGSSGDYAGCGRCCCSDCHPPREAVLSE